MKTSKERKETPIFSGVLNYFPLAIAGVAQQSFKGNEKHNPGEPLGWTRNKSSDHLDCATRHMMTPREIDVDVICEKTGVVLEVGSGQPHIVAAVWRLLAQAELILEEMRDAEEDQNEAGEVRESVEQRSYRARENARRLKIAEDRKTFTMHIAPIEDAFNLTDPPYPLNHAAFGHSGL